MKKAYLILFASLSLFSCNQNIDSGDWSGIANQNDAKTKIVEQLAENYRNGDFGKGREYFLTESNHMVNNDSYNLDEIIEGYNFHSLLYENIQHLNSVVTTVSFNNGMVFTDQWSDWSGISKITGEETKNTFHCWWRWEEDKIAETHCYFDTSDIMKEADLYNKSR